MADQLPVTINGQKLLGIVIANPGSGGGGSSALPAGTDRSGSITAGNTAQQLAPANAARTAMYGQNTSSGDLWVSENGTTAAIGAAGSYKVAAGQSFAVNTNRAISVIGATTGQTWTATELG